MADLSGDRERIAAAWRAVFGDAGELGRMQRLGGGLNNRSYRVPHGPHSIVARLGAGAHAATLDLAAEAEILRRAAAAGLAPEVLGFDAAGGVLFTRFLKSPALTAAAARTSANRARIAALLRRLHGIDASPPVFDAAGVANEYVEAAESLGALAVEDRPLTEEFLRLAEDYRERHPPTVVCHNDLHAANILDGGHLVLVDFEFAVLASPLLDLASVAALNDYAASDQGDLLRAYFAGAEPPLSAAEFAKVVRLVRLMAYFWILATARGTERSELLARFGGVARTTRNTKWQSG